MTLGTYTSSKKFITSLHPIVERFRREQSRYGLTFNCIVAFPCGEFDSKSTITQSKTTIRSLFPTNNKTVGRANTTSAIFTTHKRPQPPKRLDSFMEMMNKLIHPTCTTSTETTTSCKFTMWTKCKNNKTNRHRQKQSVPKISC